MTHRLVISKTFFKVILTWMVISLPLTSFGEQKRDSLQTSVSFGFSFGMMRDQGLDAISFLTRYNPGFNLKYNRFELGLGLDYYRYTIRLPDRYSIENIYSFTPYLRTYLFKKQYLFAELFLYTGYWDSRGELDLYEGNRFISVYGVGAGVIIPPLPRHRDHAFLKNLYGMIIYRESFVHRDILILQADVKVGLIYKF